MTEGRKVPDLLEPYDSLMDMCSVPTATRLCQACRFSSQAVVLGLGMSSGQRARTVGQEALCHRAELHQLRFRI